MFVCKKAAVCTPLMVGFVLAASGGYAATVTGTVKGPSGAAFKGAFVQAQKTANRMWFTVLSDKDGKYRIDNLPAGTYTVQIKATGYKADPHSGVRLASTDSAAHEFALQPAPVRWNELNTWQGEMLLPEGKGKDILVQRCWACHGFQTRMASVTRDLDGWRDRVQYMREAVNFFLRNFTDQQADDVAGYINSLFGPDSILPKSPTELPKYKDTVHAAFSDEAMKIVYVEYELPGPNRMPWSAAPDKDGNLWMPYYGRANMIGRLDPLTAEVQEFPLPHQIPAGVHSAVPAPDGSVWLTEQGTQRLGHWDPVTRKITEVQDNAGKHTVRVGPTGEIWMSGQRGTFDPKTGKFTHYGGGAYGIALDQQGNAWYASGNDLVRVDGATRKETKWTPPSGQTKENIFNRRIQADTDGTVWFAEFNRGKVVHFNPKTEEFKEFQVPGPAASPGVEYTSGGKVTHFGTPYALALDQDHNLWYSSSYQDLIGRLNPATGQFVEFPFPHSDNTIREFFRDAQGRTWFATPANNKVGYFYLAK